MIDVHVTLSNQNYCHSFLLGKSKLIAFSHLPHQLWEAAKKVPPQVARQLIEGGNGIGNRLELICMYACSHINELEDVRATKEKKTFF